MATLNATTSFTLSKTLTFSQQRFASCLNIKPFCLNPTTVNGIPRNKFISTCFSSSSSRFPHFLSCAVSSGGNGVNESNDPESLDAITLDVKGMMCEGCAGSVKRMLESQPQVFSANVDLATETATVLPVPEVKVNQNWQKQLGETLAKHLTNCGFNSNIQG